MATGTRQKHRQKTEIPAKDALLRPWFKSYHARHEIFDMIRDEIARLPRKDQLTALAQIDSLRENVAEMIAARMR